jgi:hypothetical protein
MRIVVAIWEREGGEEGSKATIFKSHVFNFYKKIPLVF